MKAVWKYTLKLGETNKLVAPKGAAYLTAQAQNNEIVVWYQVDPSTLQTEMIELRVIPTGVTYDDYNLRYISTVQLDGGAFVAHIFEVQK